MKKGLLVVAACVALGQGVGQAKHVILKSPILPLIDGKSYALNGVVFGLILQVRKEVREMLFGVMNTEKELVGLYLFDGKYYSITELTQIEQEIYESGDQQKITELKKLLAQIKEDFLEITKGYVENIRSFKNQIVGLLEESCKAHDRPDSFLLKWGEELDGDEGQLLREEILNFKDFERFCLDLATYLEDMAYSCTKAKALFKPYETKKGFVLVNNL